MCEHQPMALPAYPESQREPGDWGLSSRERGSPEHLRPALHRIELASLLTVSASLFGDDTLCMTSDVAHTREAGCTTGPWASSGLRRGPAQDERKSARQRPGPG